MKNNFPDSLTIQRYLDGTLEPEIMHQLERRALEDPFLADALEGYSVYGNPADDLSIMQRQLHQRIVQLQENKKVFDLTWQRLSVAAAAAVMFVAAGLLFWMNAHRPPERLASQSHKQVDVQVIDRDSVKTVVEGANGNDSPAVQHSGTDLAANNETNEVKKSPLRQVQEQLVDPEAGTVPGNPKASDPLSRTMKQARVAAANLPEAQPVMGWTAFREYVKEHTDRFKPEDIARGSVLLSVQIHPDGKLGEIRVVRGLNSQYDKEAVRIVMEGPEWSAVQDKTSESLVEIVF